MTPEITTGADKLGHLTLHVSSSVTLFFLLVLAMMITAIAMEEKIHAKKSLIVGLFGILCLIVATDFNIIPFGNVVLPDGHTLEIPVYVTAIDWGVIAIILGSSLFVDIVSRSGLFTWVAIKLTKTSYGDPLKLLWYYSLMTVIFSAVLNNVTAMIIVGSLTAVSLTKLERRELLLGFLLIEGLLTNVGGLLTLISSVPNIIVGHTAGISFVEFFLKASPFVAATTVMTILLGAQLFSIQGLKTDTERQQALTLISSFDENDGIESAGFFWFAAFMLALFIGLVAAASVLPVTKDLGIGFIALTFAAIMLIKYKADVDKFFKAIDWDLIAFFMALFVVINVMEHAHVLEWIGRGISFIIGDSKSLQGTGSLLVASATASSVTDNIPLTAMLSKILAAGDTAPDSALWWSVVFGANLGGNLTPIGSASTLVAVTIMHKHELSVTFLGFVKKAAPFALMHLLLAVGYVLLVLY